VNIAISEGCILIPALSELHGYHVLSLSSSLSFFPPALSLSAHSLDSESVEARVEAVEHHGHLKGTEKTGNKFKSE
jgi:hypothetical protein